ncbi:MAG TPA: Npt1/Npt2 family nucleotide transporter [Terriglobales bacterium]|nr:Npt1/Npt2 family nucleotide transporter [Terriglobales bacterium]
MKAWIERALNIHPGDLGRGTLLCACLFLAITSTVVGKVAGAALFLSRFQARHLALVDIASAALISLVVGSYVLLTRHTALANLVAASLCFFASTCVLFWAFSEKRPHMIWLFPVFYAWVKIVAVLAPTQIWTLANCILTTREAKRIFGMVGGGAILGWIFAGFLSRTLVKAFGTESLLLAMAVLLGTCACLVMLTWRHAQTHFREQASSGQAGAQAASGNVSSLRLIFASPYLRSIATVICISSCLTTLTGWQFMAIAQQYLVSKDALAVYFGGFNFYSGLASLAFQLLLTTRFVRRFGIGTSLALLPITILLGSAGLLIFGTLSAAVALRGSDQILRYSIDRSTTELLYLPISSGIKLRVKWFIDTVIWRFGDGGAGLTVFFFATVLRFPARDLSWVALFLVAAWLFAVLVARREYVAVLKQNVSQHQLEAEQIPSLVLDRSTADLLATNISASDPNEILYALDLLQVDKRAVHPAVRSLLSHPAAQIRSKAISILSEAGDKTARPEIERLLHDPDLSVRTDALLYLTHNAHVDPLELIPDVGDFEDFSVSSAVVAYLGRPGEAQNLEAARQILMGIVAEAGSQSERTKTEVARLLGELPDSFDPLLANLLADANTSVASEAIRSVGKLGKRRLVGDLLDRLAHPVLGREAAKALASFGESIVGSLRDHLGDTSVAIEIRREIPPILVSIGTRSAEWALVENMLQSDSFLRFSIIRALNKLHRMHPELEIDIAMVETVLAAEILGHYRSYQILHALQSSQDGDQGMAQAMSESMTQELERIFRLLALLHPSLELHAVYMGLQSKNITVRDNALEFLDNILKTQLRGMLLPLLDRKVSVEEKARIANRLVRTEIVNREEAVVALVSSDDPWLRSCGAYAIGSLGVTALEGELTRCLNDSDPLLREVARAAKERLHRSVGKAVTR